MRKLSIISFIIFLSFSLKSSTEYPVSQNDPVPYEKAVNWADSVLSTLSIEEQIGQLFMIRAHSDKSLAYKQNVASKIRKYKTGGVCFFQGGPVRQRNWVDKYQEIADVPLLVAQDAEWGPAMRLDSATAYPYQMTLGAVNNNELIYMMGQQIAKELKAIGVNMNFAPVMDVNNNPDNPVINFRSFGENPSAVYEKAINYVRGMQSEFVIACGKHFPGHGDTDKDSHHTLPVINSTKKEMDSIHLFPFREASDDGLGAVMSAHLRVPSLDKSENVPSSLSSAILNKLLREKYNYNGLIITDALEMAGVRQELSDGEIAVKAFKAGNDILLLPGNINAAVQALQNAIKNGEIDQTELKNRVRKILVYKFWATKNNTLHIPKTAIDSVLNSDLSKALIFKLYKEALTLLKNKNAIPVNHKQVKKIALVTVSNKQENAFHEALDQYIDFRSFHISPYTSLAELQKLSRQLNSYDLVITSLHASSLYPGSNYGIPQNIFDFIEITGQKTKNIIVHFGNPYALERLEQNNNAAAILIAYENNAISQKAAVEGLVGATQIKGSLPVSINEHYVAGFGLSSNNIRLETSFPYFMNIDPEYLRKIDSIAMNGIREKAFPGCQILIAKEGNIFYHKAFGYHTYNQIRPVNKTDIYDLASVTKIAATTLAVMHLSDEGKLDIDYKVSKYLPNLVHTNKENIIIRDMMAHQARLHSWIPFYKKTLTSHGNLSKTIYQSWPDTSITYKVADHIYIRKNIKDSILKEIANSRLRNSRRYKYSDLGFYMLRFIIEDLTGDRLDHYMQKTFYEPMGLQFTTFCPLERFSRRQIIPTEDDRYFRNQLIHGYVHDQGAAMLGGISGHAGLFSNAKNMAALMQMLLNKGEYAGHQFLQAETIEEFTRRQFPLNDNRRAIGFDKPLPDNEKGGPTTTEASNESFGHSGFTGTYVWADPKYDLVYVFLSNRVYPSADNWKLIGMNIRTNIQKIIYQAIQNES
ncbi:MAG: serine hydrolase [Bacteroidales bacterium]|nr:serine hydrolase [Bacteroidales bacterium]